MAVLLLIGSHQGVDNALVLIEDSVDESKAVLECAPYMDAPDEDDCYVVARLEVSDGHELVRMDFMRPHVG
jgi:hypothetical protein